MSNEQDPKNIKNEVKEEPKAIDELAGEDLDQVVGGAGPGAGPTLPAVNPNTNTFLKYDKWSPTNQG